MKRDMDLVRAILLGIEELDGGSGCDIGNLYKSIKTKGFDCNNQTFVYHLERMKQAFLIDYTEINTLEGSFIYSIKLSWEGHDFLDLSRDSDTWEKFKEKIGGKISSLSFELVKSSLTTFSKKMLEEIF